jgi:TRAP-type mannitol/chloroaromatic compound transport system substrate-binding protein
MLLPLGLAAPNVQAVETVKLKVAMGFPTRLPLLGSLAKRFAKEINQRSGGRIKLKIYEPGKLVSPRAILDAAGQGSVDAGWTVAAMSGKKNMAFHIFRGPPFSPPASEFYSWIQAAGGSTLYDELYARYNVKAIPAGMLGPEGGGWFKRPIAGLNDLQGMRVRFFGLGLLVMKKLGVSISKMPAKDALSALAKNAIDGAEFGTPYIDKSMNFDKVAKYYYYPGWHQPVTMIDLIVNRDVWNQLTTPQQQLIEQVCHENVVFGIASDARLTHLALDEIRGKGVQVGEVPPAIVSAARKAWQEVAAEQSNENEDFRRIYADYKAFFSETTSKTSSAVSSAASDISHDSVPPEIVITSHNIRGMNVVEKKKKTTVNGRAIDDSGTAVVYVNGKEALLDEDGNFTAEVYLKVGANTLTISAMDIHENKTSQTLTIKRLAPSAQAVSTVVVDEDRLAFSGAHFALIIGNNNYKYLPKLQTAIRDAQEIESVLQTDFGFNTTLLLDATRNQILKAINNSRKILKENDHFLIYYAGHGEFDSVAHKAYWLPIDAQSNDDTNWIIVDTITSNLKRIAARHIMVVADSCYSGTLTRRAVTELSSDPKKRDRYLEKMFKKSSRTLLASGGNEPVSDSGGAGHSIFAAAFIDGLRDMENVLFTAEELFYEYIKERVAGNAEQVPEYNTIRNSGHDGGDFIFVRKNK